MEKSDLKRAGIRKAKHVIILAPSINEIRHFTESQNEKSDQNTVYVSRQHLTKWSKTQYLCGVQATGAGLLSTFYQH